MNACGGELKILVFLTDPPVISKILLHLDLNHLPPPLSTARGPPQGGFLMDQASGFDAAEAEPLPDAFIRKRRCGSPRGGVRCPYMPPL